MHPEAQSNVTSKIEASLPRIDRIPILNASRPIYKAVDFWAFFVWPIVVIVISFFPVVTDQGKINGLGASMLANLIFSWFVVVSVRREMMLISSHDGIYIFGAFGEVGRTDREKTTMVFRRLDNPPGKHRDTSPDVLLHSRAREVITDLVGGNFDPDKLEFVRIPSAEYGMDPKSTTIVRTNFRLSQDDRRVFFVFVVLSKSHSEICRVAFMSGRTTGQMDRDVARENAAGPFGHSEE